MKLYQLLSLNIRSPRSLSCAAIAAAAVLTACDHKELCLDHWEHALGYDVMVEAQYDRQWEYRYGDGPQWQQQWPADYTYTYDQLRPATPEGLRATVYFPEGNTSRTYNLRPEGGGPLRLSEGRHDVIFYNNDTEYILFSQLNNFAEASATTRTRTRSTYFGSPYLRQEIAGEEHTVGEPDMLYGHFSRELEVPKQEEPSVYRVTMRPLVFTYYIRMEFTHGLEYVALCRGALSGMAAGVYLSDGHTSDERATVLFDTDLRTPWGYDAPVRTFGVPGFPWGDDYTRAPQHYGLNIEVRLRNGRILSYDCDVTDQIARQPHGGVITVGGLSVSDEDGRQNSGSFIVDVTDWGEWQDVYLPM